MKIDEVLKHIDWTVIDELQHIPEGSKGSLQAALRVEYAHYRAIHRQLDAKLTPRAGLIQAVYNLRRTQPEFDPKYDAPFFFEESGTSRALNDCPLAQEIHALAAMGGGEARRPNVQSIEEVSQVAKRAILAFSENGY